MFPKWLFCFYLLGSTLSHCPAVYGQLSESEIKTLVVDDKWLATLAASVESELDRISQALTGRIR
jgi:hypothetical protein